MRHTCGVFNTNSFEVMVVRGKDRATSLRGLYPIGALQNHCCVPNTRHHFDDRQRLHVSAALPIAAGEELTMSYTDLLWNTWCRRRFLRITKHFSCNCRRCSDPSVGIPSSGAIAILSSAFHCVSLQEFGSRLGALLCARNDCSGRLLPRDPVRYNESSWTCDKCRTSVKRRQVVSTSYESTRNLRMLSPCRRLLPFFLFVTNSVSHR